MVAKPSSLQDNETTCQAIAKKKAAAQGAMKIDFKAQLSPVA